MAHGVRQGIRNHGFGVRGGSFCVAGASVWPEFCMAGSFCGAENSPPTLIRGTTRPQTLGTVYRPRWHLRAKYSTHSHSRAGMLYRLALEGRNTAPNRGDEYCIQSRSRRATLYHLTFVRTRAHTQRKEEHGGGGLGGTEGVGQCSGQPSGGLKDGAVRWQAVRESKD